MWFLVKIHGLNSSKECKIFAVEIIVWGIVLWSECAWKIHVVNYDADW